MTRPKTALNDRVCTFLVLVPGATYTCHLGFDLGGAPIKRIYASATGKQLPDDPRDAFEVQFVRDSGFRHQTTFALASTVCGTPDKPRELDPPWGDPWHRGSVLRVRVRALQPLDRVDVVVETVDTFP